MPGGRNWSLRREFDGAAGVSSRLFKILGWAQDGDKNADSKGMSIGSINPLSLIQSTLRSSLQDAGLTNNTSNTLSGIDAPSLAPPDTSRLSPFARLISELQQLQQSDPAKYKQVTQQIATNLQNAAQTAQSDGNPTAVNQLNQLANDFTNASTSGQLPNIQDLAQAISTHHHHHSHSAHADSDGKSSASSSSSSASSSGVSQQNQLRPAFQANGAQSDAVNPMSIILNTLSSAGINGSKG
jgi:hypothetical protein